MLANNNIVSLSAHPTEGSKELSTQNKKIIASCRVILTNSLPKCFIFLGNLDDTLFKLADQAKNNIEQSEFFAAMFIFRIQQSDLKNEFTRLVLNDFDDFFTTSINPVSSNTSSKLKFKLSILHNDDLEEQIAITSITTKSNDVFGNEFTLLTRGFAQLINDQTITKNPLAAHSVFAHIKDVISPITSNSAVKLQIYKLFEQHTLSELKNLYLALNDELIKHQILPNLAQRRPSKQNSATPLTPSVTEPMPSSSTIMTNEVKVEQDVPLSIFEQQSLLINKEDSSQTQKTLNIAKQQSILSAPSEQQQIPFRQVPSTQNSSHPFPELDQLLVENLQTEAQCVSQVEKETIKIIDLLFKFILEDKVIPAPIGVMIARLKIPMLKIALKDNKFYCTKNHPARRLLNNLATISTGWNQQRTSQQNLIQDKIETIVITILTEFDTDINLFKELNIQLKQFIEQQVQSSTVAEQRIVKANEGLEKLTAAQQEVDSVINDRLSQYSHLPKVVISLIDDGWKHVLKLRLLQKGLDSPEWKDSVQLLEQLIWSVTPKQAPNDRQELRLTMPHLVKELESNLSGASFNQAKMRAYFKELQRCHLQCLNGDSLQQEDLQAIESRPDVRNIIEKKLISPIVEEIKIISDEEALQKASTLKIGTWLAISEKDYLRVMKFSWRSNLTEHCLFVSYHGLKEAVLSLAELAGLFQRGQVQMIDPSEPLMDRALTSIMNSINNQANTIEK